MGRRDKGPGGEGRGPGEGAAGRAVSAQDCFLNGDRQICPVSEMV